MPDGSCCPEGNYCESTEQGKQCCSDGQSCNAITGCVEIVDPCYHACTNGTDTWYCEKGKKCGSSIDSCESVPDSYPNINNDNCGLFQDTQQPPTCAIERCEAIGYEAILAGMTISGWYFKCGGNDYCHCVFGDDYRYGQTLEIGNDNSFPEAWFGCRKEDAKKCTVTKAGGHNTYVGNWWYEEFYNGSTLCSYDVYGCPFKYFCEVHEGDWACGYTCE